MGSTKAIAARPNISVDIANQLRDMIFDGALTEGERINEVRLAASLGVSRTPLREALATLVAEGAIYNVPRYGFFVRELTREEFEDIYPMRSILDPEALRLAGIPSQEGLARLDRINERIRAAKSFKTRVSLDDQFHLELIANCGNRVLVDLIKHFMGRFRRYGLAFGSDRSVIDAANREHREILRALRANDMERACKWLRSNLTSNTKPILEWLEKRQA